MIVTIDGPAGAGKSTVARRVARALRLPYLNTGFIYRAVTLFVLEEGGKFEDRAFVEEIIKNLGLTFVDDCEEGEGGSPGSTRVFSGGRDITGMLKDHGVTDQVYQIAGDGGYRALLVDLQRSFAEPDGVVAEGRDMGSIIFPGADYKIYLDASPEERARRQHEESLAAGRESSYEELLASIRQRDARDRERDHAPLCVADDATIVDTSDMNVDEAAREVLGLVRARRL